MKESQNDPKKIGENPEMLELNAHPEAPRLNEHPEQEALPPYDGDDEKDPIISKIPATSDAEETHGVFREAGWVALALIAILVVAALIFRPDVRSDTQLTAMNANVPAGYRVAAVDEVVMIDPAVDFNNVRAVNGKSVRTAAPAKVAAPTAVVVYLFNSDESTVPETAQLTEVARQAAKNGKTVVVKAYTDEKGRAAYNQRLSERRARAVGDYMVAHGVPSAKVRAKGYGPTHAYANNAQDRRAEVTME